jgi:hypothetical protein
MSESFGLNQDPVRKRQEKNKGYDDQFGGSRIPK